MKHWHGEPCRSNWNLIRTLNSKELTSLFLTDIKLSYTVKVLKVLIVTLIFMDVNTAGKDSLTSIFQDENLSTVKFKWMTNKLIAHYCRNYIKLSLVTS